MLHALIVGFDGLAETIGAIFVKELRDDGDRLVSLGRPLHGISDEYRILSYNFEDEDTADGVLSELASCKLVIHPFISEQKDFGYSDVTLSKQEHAGRIREHFAWANRMFYTLKSTLEIY